MPGTDESQARLSQVTVAEVAEALEAVDLHLRVPAGKDMLVVYSMSADRRALTVMLVRDDDSFVWRVAAAKPMGPAEFAAWFRRYQ